MINLPAIAEQTLATSLEGPWAYDIKLIGPDGAVQTARAQCVHEYSNIAEDSRGVSQGGRQSLVIKSSSITLRSSSLNPAPKYGEQWACSVPVAPVEGAEVQTLFVEADSIGSVTLGLIQFNLTAAIQAPEVEI